MDGIKQLNNVVGSDYVRSILTRKNTLLHMIDSYQKISGVSLTLIPPKSKIPDDWNWLPDSAINSGSGLGLVKIPTQQIKSINNIILKTHINKYITTTKIKHKQQVKTQKLQERNNTTKA